MGRQGDQARPGVALKDVTAVLDLAGLHRDTAAPGPASWDEAMARVRAVVVEQPARPRSVGVAARLPAPGDRFGHDQSMEHTWDACP